MIKLSKTTAATAALYFHSCLKFDESYLDIVEPVVLSTALLFLASKSTENIRRIRDVLNAVRHHHKLDIKNLNVSEYTKLKERIVEEEHRILRAIGFATHVELPHAYLLNYARYLDVSKAAVKFSWAFVNDSFLDERVIEVSPCLLAAASLLIGLKLSGAPHAVASEDSDVMRFPNSKSDNSRLKGLERHRGETTDSSVENGWWRNFHIKDDLLWPVVDWIAEIPLVYDGNEINER